MTLNLGMQHWMLEYYQVCSNDDPGLTLVLYAFVWGKGKTIDFSKTIVIYNLKLATDDRSDKKVSVDIKTLSPGGCMSPAPGLYTCIKS